MMSASALQGTEYPGSGNTRWMAVELLSIDDDVSPSPETDVWALGMVTYVSTSICPIR